MQKVTIFFVAAIIFMSTVSFINSKKEKVQWLTIAELQAAYSKNPRPVIVDVYTGWCGWCKVMDRETYSNDKVARYINEHYYAVKMDAETKEVLEWNGKKFNYNAAYKSNDLAIYFLNGQMSFPTTVFFTAIDAQPAALPGYLKPNEIEAPLKFFGDGIYKTKTFQEFNATFSAAW